MHKMKNKDYDDRKRLEIHDALEDCLTLNNDDRAAIKYGGQIYTDERDIYDIQDELYETLLNSEAFMYPIMLQNDTHREIRSKIPFFLSKYTDFKYLSSDELAEIERENEQEH